MALFDAGSLGYQGPTSVGTSATKIWSANTTGLAALSPAVTLRDLSIINEGPSTVYVGQSGVTPSTGAPLPAGCQMTIQGFTATSGTTTNDPYAICASGGSATVVAGLATVASVV